MSTPIVRKKDTGQSGNPGQFGHIGSEESGVTLGAPEHEALRGTISHHVAPVIGWARMDAGNRSKQDDLLEKLEARSVLAGQEIADTMAGDRAIWAGKVIRGRLGRIVRQLAQAKDKEGDYVLHQSVEDYNYQLDKLATIFARESETEGPLPVSGLPFLGDTADGYVNLELQVRMVDRLPQDSDDGTAAILKYGTWGTTERHYTAGQLHDGSGDTPSERTENVLGTIFLRRGFIRKHSGWITPQDSPDGQPRRKPSLAMKKIVRRSATARLVTS